MLTSKQRAEFRAQANSLETTLIVGKDGVTEAVIAEADRLLTARELVKGKVLETALMSAREVSEAICEATGADGISCVETPPSGGAFYGIRRRPTLPDRYQSSTIGTEGLNFCVRYGNRWDPFVIATGNGEL